MKKATSISRCKSIIADKKLVRSSDAEKTRQLIAGPGSALKRGISGLYYKSITIVTIVSDDCK